MHRNITEIEPSERTILACRCGELLIVLGSHDDWRLEGTTMFKCGACDSAITLPEDEGRPQADHQAISLGDLVGELRAAKGA